MDWVQVKAGREYRNRGGCPPQDRGAIPTPHTHTHALTQLPWDCCQTQLAGGPQDTRGVTWQMHKASASCPIHLSSAHHSGPITFKGHSLQLPLGQNGRRARLGSPGNGQERICIHRMGSIA